MAEAKLAESAGGTINPLWPSLRMSQLPVVQVVITGRPLAIASRMKRVSVGKAGQHEYVSRAVVPAELNFWNTGNMVEEAAIGGQ